MNEYMKLFVTVRHTSLLWQSVKLRTEKFFYIFLNRAVQRMLAEGEDHILARLEQGPML